MTDTEWLATAFEEHRDHLRAVAYRLLGSMTDADDAVQDTWLRLTGTDTSQVANLGGWLTTVVARVSLNMLRSRRYRHEEPVGDTWPGAAETAARDGATAGPGAAGPASRGADPQDEVVLADSVGLALLVVLDTLTPAERLAFVLHDMFAMPFTEVAAVLGRSTEAARQLASRARRRVARRPEPGSRRRPGPAAGGGHRVPGRGPRRRLLGPGLAAGRRGRADFRPPGHPGGPARAAARPRGGRPGRGGLVGPGRGVPAGPGGRVGGRRVRARWPAADRADLHGQHQPARSAPSM